MSNPTSNFGWQMPTATDLVTDLPADFEVFGQAVDTDFADLNGGTTGQILSKTSATDLDFTWVTPNAGDITGVTAGTGISGGGTSGDVTVTNSMATAIDAKGDLIAGTGADAFSRLAVGANDTVLIADSAQATGLKWGTPAAGGMTLLSTTNLSGTTTTLSSIPSTYVTLYFQIQQADFNTASRINVTINGFQMDSLSMNSTNLISANGNQWGSNAVASAANQCVAGYITNYSVTGSGSTSLLMWGGSANTGTTSAFLSVGLFTGSSPITSIGITSTAGTATFTDGSVLLYGVK